MRFCFIIACLVLTGLLPARARTSGQHNTTEPQTNQQKAQDFYFEAMELDSSNALAHRGLGMLFQEEGKNSAAADEYNKYLQAAPGDAPDRLRIERRLDTCTKGARNP